MINAIAAARSVGFETVALLNVETLTAMPEVRDMCAANKCAAYGHNWSCPPICGSLEECKEKIQQYSNGILVQSIGDLEDSWDYEGMKDLEETHKARFQKLASVLHNIRIDFLPLSAGCCTICETCAYPQSCRFPQKMMSSMEAYGLLVNAVCSDNHVAYYYGPNKLSYTSCILFRQD